MELPQPLLRAVLHPEQRVALPRAARASAALWPEAQRLPAVRASAPEVAASEP